MPPNNIINLWNTETLVELVLSSSLTFIDATSSTGTIMLRAISYFTYANINAVRLQTVYIQENIWATAQESFLKCHSSSVF